MPEWVTHTPDGFSLRVRREEATWIVRCGEDEEVRDELLDVALIEAIRGNAVVVHSPQPEYGAWIRQQADGIERDFRSKAEEADG
jgi:hypothetical protein